MLTTDIAIRRVYKSAPEQIKNREAHERDRRRRHDRPGQPRFAPLVTEAEQGRGRKAMVRQEEWRKWKTILAMAAA
jgi:hypothetical protein